MKTLSRHIEFGIILVFLAVGVLTACGGGGGGSSSAGANQTPAQQALNVPMLVSDAASEDWATIGVKLLSLTLTKSDNTTVSVTLPASPTSLNLAQLDNLGEILSSVALTPGDTYTGATLTISANPGDVTLITSADPEAGFLAAASTQIPSNQIQIQGASGISGSLAVSIPVNFVTPFVVPTTASASTNAPAVNIEFDLDHPTFIVGHAVTGGTTLWAVNFNGPVKHKPVGDIRRLVLRHMYGTVSSVSADNTSLTFTKDLQTVPVVSPETDVATTQSMTVLADSTNGTLFYDLDDKTQNATIKSFSSVTSILTSGKFVRVGARYQQNGTLVATRIWVGSTFNSVWISPEGHVLHANSSGSTIVVADELGHPVALTVNASTQFFFRQPENALADVTPIGTGLAFLQAGNIVRGFKIHAQADVTTSPITAQTIDIETAAYQGKITTSSSGVVFTKIFNTATDNYTVPASGVMGYISNTSANGNDPLTGTAITGFKYWNFAYPTIVDSGSTAISDFVSATGGNANFGSATYTYYAHGTTYASWGDPANASGWSVPWMVVEPTDVPKGTVTTALTASTSGISTFTMSITGGTKPVTVDVSSNSGQATLVYLVNRSGDVVTVTSLDITNAANLTTLTGYLGAGAIVQVSAAPQSDGSLKAYVLTVYRGSQLPSS
jgi:hypothetical protein